MLNKEKLILVFYINVDGLTKSQAKESIQEMMNFLETENNDGSILNYILPVQNQETKIECLNPKLLDDENWLIMSQKIENIQKQVEKFLKNGIDNK